MYNDKKRASFPNILSAFRGILSPAVVFERLW